MLGWREGEAITRRRRDYDAKTQSISRISTKGDKEVSTKDTREATDALEAILPHNATTLLVNSRGLPWTQDGFRASFVKLVRALEAAGKVGHGLTVHGLRHTCATRLREMGYDLRTIADMLGQKTEGWPGITQKRLICGTSSTR